MMIDQAEKDSLVADALQARTGAYAPYSGYEVGAALLTRSGARYLGANVENAAYPSSMCAERVAIFQAVTRGDRDLRAIAVATENGGSPCGTCRQVLSEFGLDTDVILVDADGEIVLETTVAKLLPDAFLPEDLANS